MEERTLDYYLQAFAGMNRATVRGIKAPHKPLLLLAVLHLVECSAIVCNRVELSKELIGEFKRLWAEHIGQSETTESFLVSDGLSVDVVRRYPFRCSIENPYYHLQHEPFWRLVRRETFVERKEYPSIKSLRDSFSHAEMDEELFLLMAAKDSAKTIERKLAALL